MPYRVLFLDHQGVMYTDVHPCPGKLVSFKPEIVSILAGIIRSDTEIVVSSDWKYWVSLVEMQDFYKMQGIKPPLDYTPSCENLTHPHRRATEIKMWLANRQGDVAEVITWVAIDDLDMSGLLDNFIHTDPSLGLTSSGAKAASEMLYGC